MSKAAALLFLRVLTGLAVKPESAQLSLDFLFPTILGFDQSFSAAAAHCAVRAGRHGGGFAVESVDW